MDCLMNMVLFWSMFDPEAMVHIQKLGDDSWRTREAATKALIKMDERPVRLLIYVARSTSDPEVRVRADRIIARQYNALRPSGKDTEFPWIDCLPKNTPNRDKVLEKAFKDYGEPCYVDHIMNQETTYRWATQEYAISLYNKGHSRKEIVKILDKMVKNEEQWQRSGGRYCAPSPPEFDE